MQAIVSPFFSSQGPAQMLRRGYFIQHPDLATRGEQIFLALEDAGCELILSSSQTALESIFSVHDRKYINYLQTAWLHWSEMEAASPEIFANISPNRNMSNFNNNPVALAGWYIADCAAPIGEYTWRNALASASAVIEATSRIISEESAVYALCRPSGHHACSDLAMGMCYLNNVAIAAQQLRKNFQRVAVLDIDMHHGNGTQQIFYERRDVLTISIHGDCTNFYPFYIGFENETGDGDGVGYNLNIPLPDKTNETVYLKALETAKNTILSFQAEVLVIATGFDTYKSDPFGCFALESNSYYQIGQLIRSINLPTLFVQEGGYFVPALRENVRQLVEGFSY